MNIKSPCCPEEYLEERTWAEISFSDELTLTDSKGDNCIFLICGNCGTSYQITDTDGEGNYLSMIEIDFALSKIHLVPATGAIQISIASLEEHDNKDN